jgi:hypothetical protein
MPRKVSAAETAEEKTVLKSSKGSGLPELYIEEDELQMSF